MAELSKNVLLRNAKGIDEMSVLHPTIFPEGAMEIGARCPEHTTRHPRDNPATQN